MLRHRLMLGPIMVVAVVLVLWLDVYLEESFGRVGLAFGALLGLLVGMSGWELARILRANGVRVSTVISVFAAVMGLAATVLWPSEAHAAGTGAVIVMLVALLTHVRHRTVEGVVAAAGGVMLVYVYLGVQGAFWILIRFEHGAWVALWLALVTKSCDIGAFFVGRSLGKHKLVPWLSPGKTWEGLVGGVLTSGLISVLGLWILRSTGEDPGIAFVWAGFLGVMIGVLGQLGDLIASLFKRDAGRKDASRSLPGFGGWLDVIDSLLLVGPFAYWAFRSIG